VPADELHRLPAFDLPSSETGELSAIDDYWSFVSMLLAGGSWNGACVLSPGSLSLMTKDQLAPVQREGNELFLGAHGSWGLGLAVPAAGSSNEPLPCGIGWDRGTGTTWRTHVGSGVPGVLFTQRQVMSPVPPPLIEDFWAGVNMNITSGETP
jgi:hypothetical protein